MQARTVAFVFVCAFFFSFVSLHAAGGPGGLIPGTGSCSPTPLSVNINQVYNTIGGSSASDYIELHVNTAGIDIGGWKLLVYDSGHSGSHYTLTVAQGYKNSGIAAAGDNPEAGDFIVFVETVHHFVIDNNQGEILLLDNDNNVVHYISYQQGGSPHYYWEGAAIGGCSTRIPLALQPQGSNGICSLPDTGEAWEANCEESRGSSNRNLGPVIHYTFDECTVGQTVTAIADSSGGGRDATGYNGLKCVATDRGHGAYFDGADDYAKSDDAFSFTYDVGFTVYGRFRFDEWTDKRAWVLFFGMNEPADSCSNNGMHWLINTRSSGDCGNLGEGVTQFGPFCGAQNRFDLNSTVFGTYVAYATVYDKASNRLATYINGHKIDQDISASDPTSGNAPVVLGRPWVNCGNDSHFRGVWDELKIYPRTLSEEEILQLFTGDGAFTATEESMKEDFVGGRIYTKVASQPFSLRIVARERDDFNTRVDARISRIEVIRCPDTACSDWEANTDVAATLDTDLTISHLTGYSDPVTLTVNEAHTNLRLRITGSTQEGTLLQTSLSKDAFSVRPSGVTVSATTARLQAGEHYGGAVTVTAGSGYHQGDANLTLTPAYLLADGSYEGSAGSFNLASFAFDGENPVMLDLNYSDVGRVELNITDTLWTAIDQNGDCTPGCRATPGADGRVGCDLCAVTDTPLTFIPYELNISEFNASVESGRNFLYFGEGNVTLRFRVDALAKTGGTTLNYDGSGSRYAHDANISLNLVDIPAAYASLLRVNDANISAADFALGSAVVSRTFGFKKNSRMKLNPLVLHEGNVTLRVQDRIDAGVLSSLRRPDLFTAGWLYPRLNPIGVTVKNTDPKVTLYYEVYGSDKSRLLSLFGTADLNESVNDVSWWRNPRHGDDPFDIGTIGAPSGMLTFEKRGDHDVMVFGAQNRTVRIKKDIDLNVNTYQFLYHHPYSDSNVSSFMIEYVESGGASVPSGPDVVKNEGEFSKSSSRIGE